jgi:hypothetical protein
MRLTTRSCIAGAGLALAAMGAQADPFVFQGQLNDEGAPADGLYDIEFILYDLENGGAQIGPVVMIDDQQVNEGNFISELDFGDDAFDGSNRYIEIRVRSGDSMGGFTSLAPRIKVGNAPQANYASKAGEAEMVSNQFWTDLAPGVLLFGEHEGDQQHFINHNRAIEPTDVMVIHSSENAPGGVTMSTWANGMPYFGYATGGFLRMMTYYDPITDAWVVNKDGDQLEIDENNDVIITNNLIVGGTITSMGDGESTIGYKSYTPDQIFAGFGFDRFFNATAGAIGISGSTAYLRTDLDLPHGALITNIDVRFFDNNASNNFQVQLWTRSVADIVYSSETLGSSNGNQNASRILTITPADGILIDNTANTYSFRFFPTPASTWPSSTMGIQSVLVEYTMP